MLRLFPVFHKARGKLRTRHERGDPARNDQQAGDADDQWYANDQWDADDQWWDANDQWTKHPTEEDTPAPWKKKAKPDPAGLKHTSMKDIAPWKKAKEDLAPWKAARMDTADKGYTGKQEADALDADERATEQPQDEPKGKASQCWSWQGTAWEGWEAGRSSASAAARHWTLKESSRAHLKARCRRGVGGGVGVAGRGARHGSLCQGRPGDLAFDTPNHFRGGFPHRLAHPC